MQSQSDTKSKKKINHHTIHNFSVGFKSRYCERYEMDIIPNKIRQAKEGLKMVS